MDVSLPLTCKEEVIKLNMTSNKMEIEERYDYDAIDLVPFKKKVPLGILA